MPRRRARVAKNSRATLKAVLARYARPVPTKRRRRRQRPRTATSRGMHPHLFLHPRLSTHHLTTPNLAATPYTVIRDKVVVPIVPSTTANISTVMLLGAWQSSLSTTSVSPLYGMVGTGGNVPGTTESFIVPTLIAPTVLARARLHRLSARICCTGGTTAGSAIPDGKIYFGTLRGVIDRTGFASWNVLSNFLLGRNELVERTNYETFTQPAHCVTCPNDFITWEQFGLLGGAPTNAVIATPDLCTMAIVFPATVNTINIDVQIDAEWTLEYTLDPILQSTHRRHPGVAEEAWHQARGFVSDHGGQVMEGVAAAALAAAAAPEAAAVVGTRLAMGGVANIAGRALPALSRF